MTTFQSLSGRGDSAYDAELVVGNVYPLRTSPEPTEALICEELAHVMGEKLTKGRDSLSVAAYRVSVQRGHLIDLRIKFETPPPALVALRDASRRGGVVEVEKEAVEEEVVEKEEEVVVVVEDEEAKTTKIEKMKNRVIEDIYTRLESWSPIHYACSSGGGGGGGGAAALQEHLPSVPIHPIQCTREGGAPRPKTHHLHSTHVEKKTSTFREGGYQVTVGNVGINDGPYDVVLTLVVDNLVKGALGAALQLMEYTLMVTHARE